MRNPPYLPPCEAGSSAPSASEPGVASALGGHLARGSRLCFGSVPAMQSLVLAAEPRADWIGELMMYSDQVRHICAGTAARTLSQVLIHPFDTIKTRLQVRRPIERLAKWKSKTKKQPLELHMGPYEFRMRNWLARGIKDIYLGVGGAALGTIPTAMVYFAVYENSKEYLDAQKAIGKGVADSLAHLLSASAGALTSAFIRVPTDTVKHRVQSYMYSSIWEAGSDIIKKQGVKGLYSGFGPTIMRDVPELAIQFALYEHLRKSLQGTGEDKKKLPTWQHLALGALSGAVAATCTMPLDVIKTVQQCSTNPISVAGATQMIISEKGVGGLMAGMPARVTQTAIMSAAFFTLFEFWKAQLKPAHMREPSDRVLQTKLYNKRRDHVWKRQFVYR